MAAPIKPQNVIWHPSITLRFGFTGLCENDATHIVRRVIKDEFSPTLTYTTQCLYVMRLRGNVAIAYGDEISPVLYIGEGNAQNRLHSHGPWLARLLLSVPNISIDIHVAEVKRQNNTDLCEYVEADMIKWFFDDYGFLPWFNRQREKSREGHYDYELDVEKKLRSLLNVGSGNTFIWAIRPTHNNYDGWLPYSCNSCE